VKTATGDKSAAIIPVKGNGGDAERVVRRAVRERAKDKNFSERLGDMVFALIDVEPHDPSKAEPLEKALKLADKEDIRVLLSNPCFEVWLLCHLLPANELKREFADPKAVDDELKKQLGWGKEDSRQVNAACWTLVREATKAAEVAREVHMSHHRGCADLRNANACTDIYRLIETILKPTGDAN
jgi:hypothetical protein